MKTIYIPWFWNKEDKIFQNYLWWKWNIIQENLKTFSQKQLSSSIEWKTPEEIYSILKKHYPDVDKDIVKKVIDNWSEFKWFTRKISTTISLTTKKISELLSGGENYKLVWHSQWWLITIKAILENPKILNQLEKIHLLAPVSDFKTWWDFHKWKESWYLNWKWVIVRPKYIWELTWNNNSLYELLTLLKELEWNGVLKLVLWKNDKVIDIKKFDIEKIKKLYPKIELEIVEWDHYL